MPEEVRIDIGAPLPSGPAEIFAADLRNRARFQDVDAATSGVTSFLAVKNFNIVQAKPYIKNVLDYDVTGEDGSVDDTAAIQAVLNLGGMVVFPAGHTFKTSATLVIPDGTILMGHGAFFVPSAAAWVRYEGMAEAIEKGGFTSNSKPVFSNADPVNGNSRIQLRGLNIEGNLTGPNHLVQFRAVNDLLIEGCKTLEGLSALAVLKSQNVRVLNNQVAGFRNGGVDTWEGNKRVLIHGNLIDGTAANSDGTNIGIFVTSQPTDSTDTDTHSAEDYIVSGNIIKSIEHTGIWIGGGATSRPLDIGKRVKVFGNLIDGTGDNGILIDASEYVSVIDNDLDDIGWCGVFVRKGSVSAAYVDYCRVNGNRFHNVGQHVADGKFVHFDDTTRYHQMIGNKGSGSGHTYAAYDRGTNTDLKYYGNDFAAGSSGTYSILGLLTKSDPNDTSVNVSTTWDAPIIADGDQAFTDVTVAGAAMGDFAQVSATATMSDLRLSASVVAANTVRVYAFNPTGLAVDASSRTIHIRVAKW